MWSRAWKRGVTIGYLLDVDDILMRYELSCKEWMHFIYVYTEKSDWFHENMSTVIFFITYSLFADVLEI